MIFMTWILISYLTGDPQEECVRCGSVYLASSNELRQGFCAKCLGGTYRSSGESGTDDESAHSSP